MKLNGENCLGLWLGCGVGTPGANGENIELVWACGWVEVVYYHENIEIGMSM